MAYRVFQIISYVIIIFCLSALITGNTEESDLHCIITLIVARNTVWRAREMETLKINCTVESSPHCWKEIITTVYWCRLDSSQCAPLNYFSHIKTEWRTVNNSTRISFLTFQNISMKDSGLYRCGVNMSTPTISHSINVTVADYISVKNVDNKDVERGNNITNRSKTSGTLWVWFWPLVCICIVIVLLVVVFAHFFRCQATK